MYMYTWMYNLHLTRDSRLLRGAHVTFHLVLKKEERKGKKRQEMNSKGKQKKKRKEREIE